MLRLILVHGTVAGLIVGMVLFGTTVTLQGHSPSPSGMVLGYLSMLMALTAVFVGVKRYRNRQLGGVIRFWPAFGMGLGISAIASVLYVLSWEAALAYTGIDFAGDWARSLIAAEQAKGSSAEIIAKLTTDMEQFKQQYAQPLYRLSITFTEIFPVGVLVSLISAALLRNSRFMPARPVSSSRQN